MQYDSSIIKKRLIIVGAIIVGIIVALYTLYSNNSNSAGTIETVSVHSRVTDSSQIISANYKGDADSAAKILISANYEIFSLEGVNSELKASIENIMTYTVSPYVQSYFAGNTDDRYFIHLDTHSIKLGQGTYSFGVYVDEPESYFTVAYNGPDDITVERAPWRGSSLL